MFIYLTTLIESLLCSRYTTWHWAALVEKMNKAFKEHVLLKNQDKKHTGKYPSWNKGTAQTEYAKVLGGSLQGGYQGRFLKEVTLKPKKIVEK